MAAERSLTFLTFLPVVLRPFLFLGASVDCGSPSPSAEAKKKHVRGLNNHVQKREAREDWEVPTSSSMPQR